MSQRSLPWLKFYPADWLSDAVAGCSLAARGLWMEMLCIMHTSERYGCLEADSKPIPDELIARRCRCASVEEYRNLLAELFSAGVPSRTSEGVIYNRRMVRDQSERDADAERQRKHRSCHAPVTPMSQVEVRGQRSEGKLREEKNPAAKNTPPADPRHKPFFDFAYEAYRQKHGQPPTWGAREGKTLNAFLKEHGHVTVEEWQLRWSHYVGSTETFTHKQGDSLVYFIGHFDVFADGPILAVPLKGGTNANRKPSVGDNMRATLEAYRITEQKPIN